MIDKLHYITQPDAGGDHLPAVLKALRAGCTWIQLRIKDREPEFILKQAILAKMLCDKHKARLIVNDYPEIALEVKAYGLHLGLSDMDIPAARTIVGDKMIIGGTANTFEHVIKRVAEGANYVGLGPFRFTTTKKKLSPILGLNGYKAVMDQLKTAQINVPVIAIGGLVSEDATELMSLGLHGIAMSGAITSSVKADEVVLSLRKALNQDTNELKRPSC